MNDILRAGRGLALDFASTLMFMAVMALGGGLTLAVALAVVLALGQIGWELWRGRKIDALQWASLCIVLVSGGAALLTRDPRFVMAKPTLIYALVGAAMLQRGWMMRYMGDDAMTHVPDLAIAFGYVWAGLMFASAILNLALAFTLGIAAWGAAISFWGIVSKLALCLAQIAVMKSVGRRRYRAAQSLALPPAA